MTPDHEKLIKKLDNANKKISILEKMVEEQTREAYYKNLNILNQKKELEQHLYIASHDLQEPLRTTLSLVECLKQELDDKILSADALLYMDGIAKLTQRMKTLISDLLDYSRLGKNRHLSKTDCNVVMNKVLEDLNSAIEESQAEIHVDPLPELQAYPSEMILLFENLVGNAIKYRKQEHPPVIHISAERNYQSWKFSLRDNGIGIEEKYKEKIFLIFQRLHTRDKYEGNGIGLAHCKKIVELHNGKIWVESTLGEGSVFHFTIPDKIYEL